MIDSTKKQSRIQETDSFSLAESDETFEGWINREFIPETLRHQLKKADLLLVPEIGLRDITKPLFPAGTVDFFKYLQRSAGDQFVVEICIPDESYEEYAFHSKTVRLGKLVVVGIVLPVIAQFIGDYCKSKFPADNKDVRLNIDIVVQDGNRSSKLHYEGKAEDFQTTVLPAISALKQKDPERTKPLIHKTNAP